MPVCFTLTPRLAPGVESAPATLQHIDDRMRQDLGYDPDPEKWLHGWYDSIGFGLAMGRTFDSMRVTFADDAELLEVIDYLDKHYIPDAFRTVGRAKQ